MRYIKFTIYDMIIDLPFEEVNIIDNVFIRRFSDGTDSEEYKWHIDNEDRIIFVLSDTNNWYIQFDNELPTLLEKSKKYYIPNGIYHRVIRGNNILEIVLIKK